MPTTQEVAQRHGVTDRTARRWRAKKDPRFTQYGCPTRPTETVKDGTPEQCLDAFYRAMDVNPPPLQGVIEARHTLADEAARIPDELGSPEFKQLVSETLADLLAVERLAGQTIGRLITRCRKYGWRPPSLGNLQPIDPATPENFYKVIHRIEVRHKLSTILRFLKKERQ